MKKIFFVAVMMLMAVTMSANNDDVTPSDLTKQVVVKKGQPVTNSQSKSQDKKQQQVPTNNNSGFGLYNGLNGTFISFKGFAPYEKQPLDNCYWPRFGVQVGAGYAQSYFTYEGVLEYMQTNIRYSDEMPEYLNSIMGSVRIGGMLPIQLGSTVLLIPNVKGQLGGVFGLTSSYATRFQASVIGGLDFGFRLGKNTITLGFAYEYRWIVDNTSTLGFGLMGGQLAFIF